jgi:hypothetical protein
LENFRFLSLMYTNQQKSLFLPLKTNRRNSSSGTGGTGSSGTGSSGPKRPRPTQPRRR